MADLLILPKTVGVNFGSEIESQHRVLKADFGYGYGQRQGDGLNSSMKRFRVNFTNLTRSEAQVLEQFFWAHGGFKSFRFTLPGEAQERFWVCEKHSRVYVDKMVDSISAEWEEVFFA